MNYGTHKDRLPTETIKIIRDLLYANGITVIEKDWNNFNECVYSVYINDSSIPNVFSNGKGVSKEYALASAYAEFMERLQNNVLYCPRFGLMKDKFQYPDEIEYSTKEYLINNKEFLQRNLGAKALDKIKTYKTGKITCVPFFSVFENKVNNLPYNYVFSATGSNGMCAGNSAEEAISQGICEIFERYAVSTIYSGKLNEIPNINLSFFKNYQIYEIMENIISSGYRLIIKDLTIIGNLPILAVILINPNNDKYAIKFAADVLIETALQRCITELAQGVSDNSISKRLMDLTFSNNLFENTCYSSSFKQKKHEEFRFQTNGICLFPNQMFNSNKYSEKFKHAFMKKYSNHKNALRYLLNKIRDNKWPVFIRDVSFLKFPSYHVYIPNISEVWNFNVERASELRDLSENFDLFKNLLKIQKLSKNELKQMAKNLESAADSPFNFVSKNKVLGSIIPLYMKKDSDFASMDFKILMTLIFHKLGDYKKAFYYLDSYLNGNRNSETKIDSGYLNCVALFFKLKSKNINNNDIQRSMRSVFGKELADAIWNDLADPEKSFQDYGLPECGNCKKCPIERDCYYPSWRQRIQTFNKKMKIYFPDQRKLSELISKGLTGQIN